MPRLIITEGAAEGLEHCRQFLLKANPRAAIRAGQAIEKQLASLEKEPQSGRPLNEHPEIRELIIPFGESGYVALYHFDNRENTVLILAFRHQKEAGYY
jgi:plasmid stabilization system protein ParE